MNDEAIWEQYYEWLIRKLGPMASEYSELLSRMFDIAFVSPVDEDTNVRENAGYLREDFIYEMTLDECGDTDDELGADLRELLGISEIVLLEVLIYLAIRLDDMADGLVSESSVEYWFKALLTNMGLENADDNLDWRLEYPGIYLRIQGIMQRTWSPDGYGFFRFMKKTWRGRAWKDIDLWYQANQWLMRNYNLGFHA